MTNSILLPFKKSWNTFLYLDDTVVEIGTNNLKQ